MSAAAREFVDDHEAEQLDDLFELLAQPSISATGEGVADCVDLVHERCLEYGFDDVVRVETPGQPAVIARAEADRTAVDGEAPTTFVYGHYDVQPADPDEWTTPPFDPTIREGPDGRERIYARGAGDNKGQWFAHLCAVRALRETTGLPTNVTLLLEGEEESGSPNLDSVVREYADVLGDADLAYVADGPIDESGRSHVLMGARGMQYVQVDVTGPNRDLHSGNYGGPVPNPAWELVRIVASLKDETGRVAIDGFYDDVRPIEARDREALAAMPFDAEAIKADLDIPAFAEGPGESYLEKLLYYPTCNICGFTSGYGGEGSKTVLPSTATLKMDMRLVADQDPEAIYEAFEAHVHEHATGVCDVEVTKMGQMYPQRTPLDHPVREPVMDAVGAAWPTEPILKPTLGGSLPTAVFERELELPCVTVPYANEDENNHSPDENLALDCFRSGVLTSVELFGRA
ncbi:succinyl-diaminopimelate desuccinylase [Halolamina pelagica]|uniref:Succinyl-diaminopimelate desuccinylase n=1 Tax=Halolamina pelagica TaxID=699431 RepID=A0A0P7I2W1_9EURY|nr:M20/M25/M40 family metallo-hydrolase [Halolamina pelagica]KPN31240.1 succinyl-diaminopimelate desuccinylase [Halolamina pelagica]